LPGAVENEGVGGRGEGKKKRKRLPQGLVATNKKIYPTKSRGGGVRCDDGILGGRGGSKMRDDGRRTGKKVGEYGG